MAEQAQYFGQASTEDVDNFLRDQEAVRGKEFSVPNLAEQINDAVTRPATSAFSMYREALGAAQTLALSDGSTIIVGKPRVKHIKHLLSNIEMLQKKAESDNPIEALSEFERIMLDCLVFPGEHDKTTSLQEWFDDLPADDGLLISETFTKVFDIKYLLSRSAGNAGKK